MAQVGSTELRRNVAAHLDRSERVVTLRNHETLVVPPFAEREPSCETPPLLGTLADATRLLEAVARNASGGGAEHDSIEG